MRARTINEFNGTGYPQEGDPHGEFELARSILLEEISNIISRKVIDQATPIDTSKLDELTVKDRHDPDSVNDIWKVSFREQYIAPILESLATIKKIVEDLEKVESVGEMDFRTEKKLDLFQKIKNIGHSQ